MVSNHSSGSEGRGVTSPLPNPQNSLTGARAPVIAIDGPTASGKGTVAHRVAQALGAWHVLDSGALYRLAALSAMRCHVQADNPAAVADVASRMAMVFNDQGVWLEGQNVTDEIRREAVGNFASMIAAQGALREVLLARQRDFRQWPGLVADGRDMGTVVFPDADLKIFLVADVQARAQRRCKQLIDKGISANIEDLLQDMRARDARDMQRAVAPLVAAQDAFVVDSSHLSIEQTVQCILGQWQSRQNQK